MCMKKLLKLLVKLFYRKKSLKYQDRLYAKISNTKVDAIDILDYRYSPDYTVELKSKHTLSFLPPIRNQKYLSSCASHMAMGMEEIQLGERRYIEGSELFHYYNARMYITQDYPNNSGMTIRDACKTLKEFGFTPELAWPYLPEKFNTEPGLASYWLAGLHAVDRYERVESIRDIKYSLCVENTSIGCGIFVDDKFSYLNKSNYLYANDKQLGGGHAVIIVGYDDERGVLIFRNSWGEEFGNNGYFEMKYDAFIKASFDWWRIVLKP